MATFARPENALKRAEELINVGQKQEALEALHSFITSRRYRAWTRTHEKIMFKYVELCVDMRRGRHAKDGLIQYRGICQQVNITSLEEVIKHFMQQALEEALDIDDLEADKRPEDLLLSYVTGEKGKDRSDRELVTPWFKFLWETYRSVLEILRNNSRLEALYAMTAHRAFQFCKQYKRTTEFRRLCEIIRNHLANLNKLCKQCVLASRVAQSFIRFGSYQLHASSGKDDLGLVRSLADYTIRHHFPHLQNLSKSDILSFSTGEGEDSVVDLTSNKYAAWAVEVAERTANCQGVGFTHGVLNTYNMSVLGLTIDYGPFGFLDAFDPSYTSNTTDLPGRRYCFANQPDIGLWNIVQLATTLSSAELINVEESNYAMERYGTKFMDAYQAIMTKKLGLSKYNKQLISDLLKNMTVDKVDYTNFFRCLSNIKADPTIQDDELLIPLKAVLLDIGKECKDAWSSWVKSYIQEFTPNACFSVTIPLSLSPQPHIPACTATKVSRFSYEERERI